MANQNNVPQRQGSQAQKKLGDGTLWPVPGTAYNIPGFIPVSSTFMIKRTDLEASILTMVKAFSKDFVRAHFEVEPRTAQISLWAWIDSNSPDIMDPRYRDRTDLIFNDAGGFMQQSAKIRRLNELYGFAPKNDKEVNANSDRNIQHRLNLVRSANGDRRYLGMQLDIYKILNELFDANGRTYTDVYTEATGNRPDMHTYEVILCPDAGRDNRCDFFSITKHIKQRSRIEDLTAKQPHRLD